MASRARREVQGADPRADADRGRQHDVVTAFLRASRAGQFDELLGLLDPDVVLRADAVAVRMGAAPRVLGAPAVAETISGRARAARTVPVDGRPGAVWAVDGVPRVVFEFAVRNGAVVAIDMVSDPAVVGALTLAELPGRPPSRLEG